MKPSLAARTFARSDRHWRVLVLVIAAICLIVLGWTWGHIERAVVPGVAGTLGIKTGAPDRDYRRPLLSIDGGAGSAWCSIRKRWRAPSPRHPLSILLAEDNVVNQKLALRIVERMGYRADLAANGVEAIGAIERQRYDLILMDVQMPEMDGLAATRAIAARWPRGGGGPRRRPWIVAMTANAMQGDREMCLDAGMDDYLTKPIRIEPLTAALIRAHATKEADRAAADG